MYIAMLFATETDHRSLKDIPDKPLASAWPRLHCSTFKLRRCSLTAYTTLEKNSFMRFFFTAVVWASMLQKWRKN